MNFAFYTKYHTSAYIIFNVFRRMTQMRVSKNTHTQTDICHTLYSLIINSQYQNSYGNPLRYIIQCLLHYHTRCVLMDHQRKPTVTTQNQSCYRRPKNEKYGIMNMLTKRCFYICVIKIRDAN